MLTKSDVDRLAYDPGGKAQQITWDAEGTGRSKGSPVSGFGVRRFPSGVKSFVLAYRTTEGKTGIATLGKVGSITLDQARVDALALLAKVRAGADPAAEKKRARAGTADALTVAGMGSLFMERHAKKEKKSWREDQRRLDQHIVPALGRKLLTDVTVRDVADLHSHVGDRGRYEANRTLALLSTLFAKAVEWGHLAGTHPSPTANVTRFAEESRETFVDEAPMPTLMAAIAEESNIYARGLILLALLTGARKGELLSLRWDQVDVGRKLIHLPDTKNGKAHRIALSDQAVALLAALPRKDGSPWVFPGRLPGRHLATVTEVWDRVRRRAGMPHVRFHDLRRTAGSWMYEDGATLGQIGQVLNHRNTATTEIYARLTQGAGRAPLERHGARLMAAGADRVLSTIGPVLDKADPVR